MKVCKPKSWDRVKVEAKAAKLYGFAYWCESRGRRELVDSGTCADAAELDQVHQCCFDIVCDSKFFISIDPSGKISSTRAS